MTATATRAPRFMDMTAEQLREAYWFHRNAGARWADMGTMPAPARQTRGKIAGSVFYHQDRMDLIVNVARKRGINLLSTATCGLCGEEPHTNSRPCPEAGYVTVGNEDWA